MKKRLIVFDMDGTLNESATSGLPSMMDALRDLGYGSFSEEEVLKTFGALDKDTEVFLFGERAEELKDVYWAKVDRYYNERYSHLCRPFQGTEKMLACLKEKGFLLAVCSNAQPDNLENMIRRLGLFDYFDVLQAAMPKGTKSDSLRALLEKINPEEALMVGDRFYDLQAARDNHIPFAACLYGYGEPAELAGADIYLEQPMDLADYYQKERGVDNSGATCTVE